MKETTKRTLKEARKRKDEILKVAVELFYKNGFENTSIEDIVRKAGIARGTLYYHFNSKMEILEEIVDAMSKFIVFHLTPIIESNLNAIEKLNKILEESIRVKIEKFKKEIIVYLKIYYDDKNIIFRQKMNEKNLEISASIFSKIIGQGVKEGIFDIQYPEYTGRLIARLLGNFGDDVARTILNSDTKQNCIEKIYELKEIYLISMERILALPKGSLGLKGYPEMIKEVIETYFNERRDNDCN